MQVACGVLGPGRVSCQFWCHFERDEAIVPVSRIEAWSKHGEGVAGVGDDQLSVGIVDVAPLRDQAPELLVRVGALNGPGEDRRIRRNAADAIPDPLRECAVAQVIAREVVEPWALIELGMQLVQLGYLSPDASAAECWPGSTSVSDRCHTGWSPAVSTLKP